MEFGNFGRRGSDDSYWEDRSTRHRFISKVCTILSVQMLITFGIACLFIYHDGANSLLKRTPYLIYVGMGGFMVISMILICFLSVARTVPINYILLLLATLFMTIIVCCSCIRYDPNKVLTAVGITCVVCICLTLFAIFAPWDFTGWGPYLCIAMIVLMLLGIVNFLVKSKELLWIIVCVGILLYSMYLVYDVQLMVGGHKNEYSEEDYIIAALCIYTDVMHLFLFILALLGLIDK